MSLTSRAAWIHAPVPDQGVTMRTRRALAHYFGQVELRAPGVVMAGLFTEDLVFDIPQPSAAIPWSGALRTREELATFIDRYRADVLPQSFELRQFIVEGSHAIALGELVIWLRKTHQYLRVGFASHYTLQDDLVSQLKIYERSHELDGAEREALGLPDNPEAVSHQIGGVY